MQKKLRNNIQTKAGWYLTLFSLAIVKEDFSNLNKYVFFLLSGLGFWVDGWNFEEISFLTEYKKFQRN